MRKVRDDEMHIMEGICKKHRENAIVDWLESEEKRLNIEFREHEKDERKRRDLVSRYYYVQDQAAKLREKVKLCLE